MRKSLSGLYDDVKKESSVPKSQDKASKTKRILDLKPSKFKFS